MVILYLSEHTKYLLVVAVAVLLLIAVPLLSLVVEVTELLLHFLIRQENLQHSRHMVVELVVVVIQLVHHYNLESLVDPVVVLQLLVLNQLVLVIGQLVIQPPFLFSHSKYHRKEIMEQQVLVHMPKVVVEADGVVPED